MPIVIACPTCKARLKIPDAKAGTQMKCPKCQGAMSIPRVGPGAVPAGGVNPLAFDAGNPFAFDQPAASSAPAGVPPPPPRGVPASIPQTPAFVPAAPLPDFYAGRESSPRKPRRGVNVYTLLGILLGLGALPLAMEVHLPLVGVGLSGLGVVLGLVGIMVAVARRGSALALALLTTAMCGSSLYTAVLSADGPKGILRAINKIINKSDEQKESSGPRSIGNDRNPAGQAGLNASGQARFRVARSRTFHDTFLLLPWLPAQRLRARAGSG